MARMLGSLVLVVIMGSWQLAAAGFRVEIRPEAVLADDEATRAAAIAGLKREGPAALPKLLAIYDQLRQELSSNQPVPNQTNQARQGKILAKTSLSAKIARCETAIDEVAGQRYAYQSRLYWYTDLDQAKAAAAEQKKPILSLRMLGKLTEDFSCANSRFFRTTLYSNAEVSQLLRDKFVLHWRSVRPVPRVTIDFGDGRKLERTLTGNSIHYVLTADGQIIDGIPGLYGPAAFLNHLKLSLVVADRVQTMNRADRTNFLITLHQDQLAQLDQNWAKDYQAASDMLARASHPSPLDAKEILERLVATPPQAEATQQVRAPERAPAAPPPATKAVETAIPKRMLERPLVRAAIPVEAANPVNVTDDRLWQLIAQLHSAEAKLDSASVQLISSQNPVAAHAARIARTKAFVESPLVRMVRTLEGSIAADTVRNEYQFHRQIHDWLANNPAAEVEEFNERVYAQLFLTPSSDPWLGLAPEDTYTALPNAGVASAQPTPEK